MKRCSVCEVAKPLTDFTRRAAMRDGRRSDCRECVAEAARIARSYLSKDALRAKYKAEYGRNREKKLAAAKAYNRANKDRVRESARKSKRLNWSVGLVSAMRGRAKRAGLVFDLTPAILLAKFKSQEGRCYWFGTPIVPSIDVRGPWRPSVDRLDNDLGYTEANTVLTCMFANMGRSSLSAPHMRAFVSELRAFFYSENPQ